MLQNGPMGYLKYTHELITSFAEMRDFDLGRSGQSGIETQEPRCGETFHAHGCDAPNWLIYGPIRENCVAHGKS